MNKNLIHGFIGGVIATNVYNNINFGISEKEVLKEITEKIDDLDANKDGIITKNEIIKKLFSIIYK